MQNRISLIIFTIQTISALQKTSDLSGGRDKTLSKKRSLLGVNEHFLKVFYREIRQRWRFTRYSNSFFQRRSSCLAAFTSSKRVTGWVTGAFLTLSGSVLISFKI